ncbi:enoyl-CoA hydratase [Sediminibacillus dalangtanensis]|uniref:Enoyl-CoA hydratase n=1 Tax=Sediminibacillus dalangtanensis TaxID=2729421 RepID=A0ABX7VWR9_9BACI|nr:MaoC/PaaZ C-terminal domain-containing protein [Sediminibacillus dalangtanensis]QTN00051.1 enoyl-CoA hydratase [Sediminibacillus dalangtanensis]
MFAKKRPLGKKISELNVGDSYQHHYHLSDQDLLLYLGITNDANPLYLQHDYASQTPYKRPIVPSVALFGVVSSVVSMHLPGPGSHIIEQQLSYPSPVYHESKLVFHLQISSIDLEKHQIRISVTGQDSRDKVVLRGTLIVCPAYEPKSMIASSLENFY